MNLLNNPWVIGIGAGILSGLLVAWITRFIFSKRDNKEYFQKVYAANREVMYALRPGISEGQMPSKEIIDYLISATARKYDIQKESMFTVNDLISELIKEFMDSAFIASSTKLDFCNKLSTLTHDELSSNYRLSIREANYSNKYRQLLVLVTALMTTLMTLFVVIIGSENEFPKHKLPDIIALMVPASIAILIAMTSSLYLDWIVKRKSKNNIDSRLEEKGIESKLYSNDFIKYVKTLPKNNPL